MSCERPAREHPAGSAPSTAGPPLASAGPVPADTGGSTVVTLPPPTPTVQATEAPRGASSESSAYVGCGQPIPIARLWDETTEAEVLDAIAAAKSCAAEHGRRLLLEFVAPWCADCREMARLDETELVAATLQRRFERVRVNVGQWDRHEALRSSFDVHALATYIVIEPKTSKLLAKTTLEPITKKGKQLSAEQWVAWLSKH